LSEAELYAPDLNEGELDVDYYRVPDESAIPDPYLRSVWEAALQLLDDGADGDDGDDGEQAAKDEQS